MGNHFEQTISDLQAEIRVKEEELAAVKQTVNMLCDRAGRDQLYQIADIGSDAQLSQISSDTFYGQPLNSSIRSVLEMRRAAGNGPAKVREIYDTLVKGGYEFDAKNDDNAMRGLRISLGKSTHTFHKLPNGDYGLIEWYPAIKSRSSKNSDSNDESIKEGGDAVCDQ
tara:strand:+ start:185 stop:688 length:504 start_codon:yes stop_codon:yes gene_type:complete